MLKDSNEHFNSYPSYIKEFQSLKLGPVHMQTPTSHKIIIQLQIGEEIASFFRMEH